MSEKRRPYSEAVAADSDRHLVARVRMGDKAAFEQLFQRHYRPVQRILCRMLGDPVLADDLAQDTFLALYMHPPQLQADDELVRAWLYRVALNRGYNALRSRRRQQEHLPALSSPAPEVDPEQEALRAEERAHVRAALAALPERQAKLLLLRQEEGLKYAEIAAILEVAPGSIGTLLVRAERAFQLAFEHLTLSPAISATNGEHQP
jgi:RNA polymerase sigma-70 factor (ECF subfamily)